MYLYILADSGMPVDLRLAFLIELSEPLIELINKEWGLYPFLRPGDRGTSLKQCLNALILGFGQEVFKVEIFSQNFNDVLETLVKSRVRVMHIKTKMPAGKYFDGPYSVYYMRKMSLLYRIVLLELLGISRNCYQTRLIARVAALDERIR